MKDYTNRISKIVYTWLIALCFILLSGHALADNLRVAVASNFSGAIKQISRQFEADTNHKVVLIIGATGKHYAQIINSAPFDIFLAADVKRPKRLEQEGIALANTRFTYAIGKLVLWSPKSELIDKEGKVLDGSDFRFLAVANPKLAPYGKGAQQILQGRGLWKSLRKQIVRGENISQTFQFVKSGNAELGFVAYSQIKAPDHSIEGSYWEIPQSLYDPIKQQAVLLKDTKAAREFLDFMKDDKALKIIKGFGYGVTQNAE